MSAAAPKPPGGRTDLWQGINEAAAAGEFRLQVCSACGAVQYPPREICCGCLGDTLAWRPVDGRGVVLAGTHLHASVEPYFRDRAPVCMGSVKLDCGPVVISFLDEQSLSTGSRVRVSSRIDESGQAVMVAVAENE